MWTGTRMLVVPIASAETTGSLLSYDPPRDVRQTVGRTGFPAARRGASFAWSGDRLAMWGGYSRAMLRFLSDGALYDPASDTWTPMTHTGAPSGRTHAMMAWAGDRFVVFGGKRADATGGQHDPVSRVWTPLPTEGAPPGGVAGAMIWTGSRLVVRGGCETRTGSRRVASGGLYDPSTERWSPMAAAPIGPRGRFAYAWTGREILVWGGVNFTSSWVYYNDGARYDPEANAWTRLLAASAPARAEVLGVWTDVEFIPWDGWESMLRAEVGRWVASDDRWRLMSVDGAPGERNFHAMVWTGRELPIAGGRQLGVGHYPRPDGAAWRP